MTFKKDQCQYCGGRHLRPYTVRIKYLKEQLIYYNSKGQAYFRAKGEGEIIMPLIKNRKFQAKQVEALRAEKKANTLRYNINYILFNRARIEDYNTNKEYYKIQALKGNKVRKVVPKIITY